MSTASSDCNSVVSLRNEERDKSGLNPTIYRTKSEMLGPSKRVLPSNPSLEVANSTQATFIALKNKYKIPFRFLKGVVPMIEDDTVCPKELKHRIQQFAHFLDLERDQFVELNIKPEVLMNLDTTMDTILHMFRPLLKEVVQWVETFGRSMFQMEPSYLSNHLSFSSEEKSSNSTADLLQTNPSNNQQSTWASEKEQVISILSSKSSRDGIVDSKQRVDPSKVENEESCISDELNKDKPPWNCQLQTAAITTIDYVKRFTKYMTQSNALKEERLRGQWEILKSLKSISDTGNQQFVHEELYENLKFACSSVERRYPHLHHELYYDAVIYIICKAKCTIIQLPLLFLFPSIENDGNVFFLIQNEACGGGELGESLITHFYEQIATQLTLTRNVSSILKIWGHITQSFMEMILKETRKST
ncbi:hypothetical protein Gasu2_23030 [Galdieria sulphuraria]|nr:hypothetical protein Gasu2_23030 [Galdieria sulphuraria]